MTRVTRQLTRLLAIALAASASRRNIALLQLSCARSCVIVSTSIQSSPTVGQVWMSDSPNRM